MIQKLATDAPEGSVTADNFAGLVAVLDDFASAAGYAVERQRQDKRRAADTSSVYYLQAVVDGAHPSLVFSESPSSNEDLKPLNSSLN
jgi:hypothetical protein